MIGSTSEKRADPQSILGWYDTTRSTHIDLVGDYLGSELFLIEGDSLLRYCFEDKRIDFDYGLQILHAVYVVENFLHSLVIRRCRFDIIFFEENVDQCIPAGTQPARRSFYLLVRTIIRKHLELSLQMMPDAVNVKCFTSPKSQEFKKYLRLSLAYFILMHNGSSPKHSFQKKICKKKKYSTDAKKDLIGMIYYFSTHDLSVGLLNMIEFCGSKVFTMIIESPSMTEKTRLLCNPYLCQEMQLLLDKFKLVHKPDSDLLLTPNEIEEYAVQFEKFGLKNDYLLISFAVLKFLSVKKCRNHLASALLLHAVILRSVSLSHRRFHIVKFSENCENEIIDFLGNISQTTRDLIDSACWNKLTAGKSFKGGLVDFIDGRLYRIILKSAQNNMLKDLVPIEIKKEWDILKNFIKEVTNVSLTYELTEKRDDDPGSFTRMEGKAVIERHGNAGEDLRLLSFSSPIFDKYFDNLRIHKNDIDSFQCPDTKRILAESKNQRKNNNNIDSVKKPTTKISKWNHPLRLNQVYMDDMMKYSASLAGISGKFLKPEIIYVATEKNLKSKKKKSSSSKAKQIIATQTANNSDYLPKKALESWQNCKKLLDSMSNNQARYLETCAFLDRLDSKIISYIEWDVGLYLLQSLLKWWVEYCEAEKKSNGYHVMALIWKTIRGVCNFESLAPVESNQILTKVCKKLGIIEAWVDYEMDTDKRKLSFNFQIPSCSKNIMIDMTPKKFQLTYCGPYMDRILDAKPDSRLPNFIPDAWQTEVLNNLDSNNSVFVVAPTSAGKTFISFYAMKKILQTDDKGVLVYIAPTKALVNQIAAEIQARLSKSYSQPGRTLWAVHTRDYQINNPLNCQILVTVPHILQIMLLSPSNARSWAPNVQKIIFDEIHCIGEADDGVVWEQLLLLAPCPIIALSATVGNPENFNDWLSETQRSHGFKLQMIQHKSRYNDLRKYIYEPPRKFEFKGLGKVAEFRIGLDDLEGLRFFHPIASLIDKSRGIPDDLALESRDCLTLWDAMSKVQNKDYHVPDALDPEKVMPAHIRKKDVLVWEENLKELLAKWMRDDLSPFDEVVQILTLPESLPKTQASGEEFFPKSIDQDIDPHDLKLTTLPLLYQLHKRNALPAIVFIFDRNKCEEIANAVLEQLLEAELKFKRSPEWEKKMNKHRNLMEINEKKQRKTTSKSSKKSRTDEEDDGSRFNRIRDIAEDVSMHDPFDPEAPQDGFTFANPKFLSKDDLDKFIEKLKWKNLSTDFIDLLKRGIGVHHSGLNRKYRQTVEMLFRKGFLRVVIATGTLSLGINMPCATVVFGGDSVFLNALNFRQASGRSGRRGFDLLGNVVFQGLRKERACRLLSSRLPELTGHFPLSTSLILRLFMLLSGSQSSEFAEKMAHSLLNQSRLSLTGNSFREQVLHHLRFSVEYLRRNELLGPYGQPLSFSRVISHLHYKENSSFAFHALLRGKYFHNLCENIAHEPKTVLQELILTLCHLFDHQFCRKAEDSIKIEKIKQSPSKVYLPPLPTAAMDILEAYNDETLDIYTTYVKTLSENMSKEECVLPLTHTRVGLKSGFLHTIPRSNSETDVHDKIKEDTELYFLPHLPTPKVRSLFFALSGLGDDFETIKDLCSSCRGDVNLESSVVPHLEIYSQESGITLNSYLLDFYNHGALEPLIHANGIRESDAWYLLNEFSRTLATITTSLGIHLGKLRNNMENLTNVIGCGELAENEDDLKISACLVESSAMKINPEPTTRNKQYISGKNKVPESWSADEDKDISAESYDESAINKGITKSIGTSKSQKDDENFDNKDWRLLNVYRAFVMLRNEFDARFKEIWS